MPSATVRPIGSTDRRVGLTSAERWPWICSRRACSISHPELHPFKHRPLKEGKLIMIGSVCCPRLSKKSLKRVRPVNRTLGAVLQRNHTEHIRQNGGLQFRKKRSCRFC